MSDTWRVRITFSCSSSENDLTETELVKPHKNKPYVARDEAKEKIKEKYDDVTIKRVESTSKLK